MRLNTIWRWLLAVLVVGAAVAIAPPVGAQSGTDNFTITRYDVTLSLGRDDAERSTLKTTETITADFPPNQNRGLARRFVKSYDGHDTDFRLVSVTDEAGRTLAHHWNGDELRIGDKNVYVSGQKTYVITYTQRDVTKHYADTGKDEFYWDAIGVEWRVPIEAATASLQLDPNLAAAKQTDLQCYRGEAGAANSCDRTDEALTVTARNLAPREGLTIALGFAPGTFAAYQPSPMEKLREIWWSVQVILLPVVIITAGLLTWAYTRSTSRQREVGTIVPEYLPPPDTSVTAAADVGKVFGIVYGSVLTAQLLDLAVRHYVKIYETKPPKWYRTAEYEIEVIKDPQSLKDEERELLHDMFGATPKVGERLSLKKLAKNEKYYKRTLDNDKKLRKLVRETYDLRAQSETHRRRFRRYALIALVAAVIGLSPLLLILALVAYIMSFALVLTDKGLVLRRYLEGLKRYITVAETERIKLLQSPDGAAKTGGVGDDEAKLVKLYERVLPYAVLFGLEKKWSEQIGRYYEQAGSQPDWYTGTNAFNAVLFASSMRNLSAATTTASSASSSTGGSGGGGFSGGGGGGGGGGGW